MRYFIGLIFVLSSCLPDLGSPQSLIEGPRILAIRSDPAEVFPGESVWLTIVAADALGPVETAAAEWAFCATPKAPVENNVVDDACLRSDVRAIAGNSQRVMATVPDDACALFGPLLPPSGPGDPQARPRDADVTGGYYQPVRVQVLGLQAIGLVRIRCGVALATPDVASRFQTRYVPNLNPSSGTVRFFDGAQPLGPSSLPAGRSIFVRFLIPAESRERYLRLDLATRDLAEDEETLAVSWLSSTGRFALARTWTHSAGILEESVNTWTVPNEPGAHLFWTVVRDSRGGVVAQPHAVQIVAP